MASDFTSTDIKIIISMVVAILMISHTMPLLGMGGDPAEPDDFPDLDIEGATFDLAGEQPTRPESAGEVLINYHDDAVQSDLRGFHVGSSGTDESLLVTGDDTSVEGQIDILYNEPEDGVLQTQFFFDSETRFEVGIWQGEGIADVDDDGAPDGDPEYRLVIEVTEYQDDNGEINFEASSEMVERPGAAGWLSGVPVIGGALEEVVQSIYETLTWMAFMFLWVSLVIVEYFINIFAIIAEIAVYGVQIIDFMIGGYFSVIGDAHGFATIILAVPGLLLSLELLKIGLILVNALWLG